MELDSLRVSLKRLAREDHINHQELSTVLQAEIKTRYLRTPQSNHGSGGYTGCISSE